MRYITEGHPCVIVNQMILLRGKHILINTNIQALKNQFIEPYFNSKTLVARHPTLHK